MRPLFTLTGPLKTAWRVVKYGSLTAIGTSTLIVLHKNDYHIGSIGVVRFGRAALTATRIVIDYKWSFYGLNPSDNIEYYRQVKSMVHKRSAERLLKLACANGGAFIKVGQHCGALDYLLPNEYVKTLSVLHSKAPESDLHDIMRVIKEELHVEPSELFVSFSEKPLGAASLAQVHKATLKDGRTVAMKVQHRRVKPNSFVDITTMEFLARCVAYVMPEFRLHWLVEEMRKNLPVELDFMREGYHADRVRRMFSHLTFLKVPEIHWDLSTDRVLTMEYMEGGQVNDLKYIEEHGISPAEVCKKLGRLYSEMIFIQGYVHCDPHPGNVLVYKHPKRGLQIVLLDHGLYTTLDEDFRLNYASLWLALLKADLPAIKQAANNMGVGEFYGLFACMVTARSWQSVTAGIDKASSSAKEHEDIKKYVAAYLPEISDVLSRVPRPMLLILKTNDLLRGIEFTLKTAKNAYSFLEMSRYCARAVYDYAYKRCESRFCCIRIQCLKWLALGRITLYTWILSFMSTLGSLRRQLLLATRR